jgi:hypothetical protein
MKSNIEAMVVAAIVFAAALGFSSGATSRWFGPLPTAGETRVSETRATTVPIPDTPIDVVLSRPISSETARPGDVWRGSVIENVIRDHDVWIPAGTRVTGIVTAARSARHGSRAMLELSVRALELPEPGADRDHALADATRSGLDAASLSTASVAVAVPLRSAAPSIPASPGNGAVMGVVAGTPAARVMAVWSGVPVALREGAVMSFSVDHTVAVR